MKETKSERFRRVAEARVNKIIRMLRLLGNCAATSVYAYDCIFSGEVAAKNLEDVFYIFNMARPKGYKGRSLSVSDVVAVCHSSEEKTYYYCEPIGFKQISFDICGENPCQ